MAPLIEVTSLTKDYSLTEKREGVKGGLIDLIRPRKKTLRAVADVSFSIERGEMVGYIGANGAGKSTTIKMLSGILTPTSGNANVGGLVPWIDRQKYTRHIGAVFGQRTQLWWDLAVVESFRLLQKIYEVDETVYQQQMKVFQDLLGLDEYLHQPVRKLSLGQRMRCDLAAALLHKPSILFLDEPTIGLDVVAKENVRHFLKGIQQEQGVTVILTTHDLGDIEHLCNRVIIIDKGRVHFDGELASLRKNAGAKVQLQVDLREATSSSVLDAEFHDLPVVWQQTEGQRHVAKFQRTDISSADVIRRLVNAFAVSDLHLAEAPIEEIVSRIYREGGAPTS
jgi:ABC-2 type transport system ATP-binding protein